MQENSVQISFSQTLMAASVVVYYYFYVMTTLRTYIQCSLVSQLYFSVYAHVRAKVGGGREGKIRLGRPARFSWLQLKILSLTDALSLSLSLSGSTQEGHKN